MPSLGPAEILVILVVALLVFGPNKMPEIGRQVARGVREFRRVQQHLSSELQSVVSDLDPTAPAPASSGGDTVPSLPPKDITETSAAEAPAAVTPPPAEPASSGHDPSPPVDLDPGAPNGASAPSGEPATPPPAETA
jgi:sec-independent protein translocase protein TatA